MGRLAAASRGGCSKLNVLMGATLFLKSVVQVMLEPPTGMLCELCEASAWFFIQHSPRPFIQSWSTALTELQQPLHKRIPISSASSNLSDGRPSLRGGAASVNSQSTLLTNHILLRLQGYRQAPLPSNQKYHQCPTCPKLFETAFYLVSCRSELLVENKSLAGVNADVGSSLATK
jgi:hypothetical protein